MRTGAWRCSDAKLADEVVGGRARHPHEGKPCKARAVALALLAEPTDVLQHEGPAAGSNPRRLRDRVLVAGEPLARAVVPP